MASKTGRTSRLRAGGASGEDGASSRGASGFSNSANSAVKPAGHICETLRPLTVRAAFVRFRRAREAAVTEAEAHNTGANNANASPHRKPLMRGKLLFTH